MDTSQPSQVASSPSPESGNRDGNQSPRNTSVSSQMFRNFQQDIRQSVANCEKLIKDEHGIVLELHGQQTALLEDILTSLADMNSNLLDRINQIEKGIDSRSINTRPGDAIDNKPLAGNPSAEEPPYDVIRTTLLRADQRIHELEADLAKLQAQQSGPGLTAGLETIDEIVEQRTNELTEKLEVVSQALDRSEEDNQRNIDRLQSMIGNIRVMCRIRPKLQGEESEPEVNFGPRLPSDFSHHWGKFKILEKTQGVTGDVRMNTRDVALERIFGPEASNTDVFAEVQDLIECSMRGESVCIFCYGASGSGKTHTMGGAGGTPGLIDQTMAVIFKKAERKKHRYQYKFQLSIVEIYVDNIIDLATGGPREKISADQAGWVELDSVDTAQATVARAVQARSVAKTTANANSSRSHMVFSLQVTRKVLATDEQETVGLLNLIDLAGSERVSVVTNTNIGRQEGTAINKSLTDLTSMLDALGKGRPLAPTSALGRLLKPCFVAGSKTLMFINISPLERDYGFTKLTLERGAHAYQVKLEAMKTAKSSRQVAPKRTPAQRPSVRRPANRPS